MIPKINKIYNCFNDGKIRESRRYKVKIKEIVPFDMIDKEILSQWKEEVKTCYWLYDIKTDYFIITDNYENEGDEIFVRTLNKGWFSMGFLCSGRLDIDGTFIEKMRSND